ncbi:LOW QUALITY PROTEIN: RelB/StbD replicon stabilization protein [Psychrobacter sp. JCM 18900]|nr:LOW QUALITY PROTEIN: RelB/StbD replicon stabilization protein [Psychrobacter sp. JCM 18900]
MQYTAIIKDGGLFIPNVFSDLNDGGSYIVQVEVDIAEVRQQLGVNEAPKTTVAKKSVTKAAKKTSIESSKRLKNSSGRFCEHPSKSALDELEALDDSELSEIFKAYMNDGQESSQISLENL